MEHDPQAERNPKSFTAESAETAENGFPSPPLLKGDLGGFSIGLYGATLVVALQGGHETRPYRKSPLPPFIKGGFLRSAGLG
jgi:hypothetical protein